jgi:DNA-binding transcriptional LysR family regulator
MNDISDMQLRRLDPTLLLLFLGLMRRRKATDAARDLGLTQSAASQGLARLRDVFGDPLFLRRPHGMEPTALAIGLEAPIRAAVEALRGALGTAERFDPATARRVLRVSALDSDQATLLPALARACAREAPGIKLVALPLARRAAEEALRAGEIDLALGLFARAPEDLIAMELSRQSFSSAGPPDVIGEGPLTLRRFIEAAHVLVSPAGDLTGVVDEALAKLGAERRVVASVPHFFTGLAIAAEAGCLITLPSSFAARHAPSFGLAVRAPPVELSGFHVTALRHPRSARDGAVDWALDRLREAAQA